MPEAIVPKVGHGPKMGQNGFDRACVSVVFLFLLCFIAHSYEANGGTDMEVLACFRPAFCVGIVATGQPGLWAPSAEEVWSVWTDGDVCGGKSCQELRKDTLDFNWLISSPAVS